MTPEREQQLVERIALLERENELLRQKLDLVLRKLFGKSSEMLDPAQLELLLGEPPGKAPASLPPDGAPEEANASSAATTKRKPRRERIPDHLPVVEEVLLPDPVKACPDAWRRIGDATATPPTKPTAESIPTLRLPAAGLTSGASFTKRSRSAKRWQPVHSRRLATSM